MLGSLTKPTTCGDNNNRIISAQQPQRCIIQQIQNKMCAELSNSPRLPVLPMWPTYAKTCPLSIKLSSWWLICYPVLSEHKDRDIMALRRCRNCLNDYEDVFQIHFICCAITAVCRCVISAEQMARIPDCRRKQSGAISHEMTLVRGELCAPLHSDCSVQHLSAQYKRTGYNCT